MAHTKSQGAVRGNRDSISKRLGIKVFGGQRVINGNIIVRQRGTKYHGGKGVRVGNDYTIYSVTEGTVQFKKSRGKQVVEVI